MSASTLRPAQARALLDVINLLILSHLPLDMPLDPVYYRIIKEMRPHFNPPKSVAAMALAVQRVFAFRKAAFHEALAQMDPRPPMAVAFMASRINNSADGAEFVPPFMAATVHFFTPDWKLVAHTAAFALNDPDVGDIEYVVGNVVREYMPDPQALLCGITAAANADSARAVHALQDKLRDLGPANDYTIAAQPCFAHVMHSIATKRTNPGLVKIHEYVLLNEPGKWTTTRDNTKPLRDGVTKMLAKIRAVWPLVMTKPVYHALFLDPPTRGKLFLEPILSVYAADLEGELCPRDAFQARWTRIRDEILSEMDVFDIEDVCLLWEEAMGHEDQGDGTGWEMTA
ncbi:hypothetical protein GGF32_000769 [Allomyces javanicus]|nr:hypothetical protein GGF32_000769 [Allomyces javanicus]